MYCINCEGVDMQTPPGNFPLHFGILAFQNVAVNCVKNLAFGV